MKYNYVEKVSIYNCIVHGGGRGLTLGDLGTPLP